MSRLKPWCLIVLMGLPATAQADAGSGYGPEGYEARKGERGEPMPLRQDPLKLRGHRAAAVGKGMTVLGTARIDPPREQGVSVEPVLASYRSGGVDHVIAAWHQIDFAPERDRLQLGAAVSHDSGASWQARVYAEVGNLGSIFFDPYAAADAQSGTLWAGALARPVLPAEAQRSPGLFLIEARGQGALSEARVIDREADDKTVMAFRREGNQTRLVIAGTRFVRWSDDLGVSFNRVANNAMALGEGTGYAPVLLPGQQLLLTGVRARLPPAPLVQQVASRSTDLSQGPAPATPIHVHNYTTLATLDQAVPGRFRMAPFGQTASASDGTLYHVYPEIVSGGNVDVLLLRSTDGGQTWSAPVTVNADQNARDQFHPALAVAPDGSVHVLYFDTRRSQQEDTSAVALLDVVHAVSRDGGNSFAETFLTGQPFEATNIAWRPFGSVDYFVGDYLALTATADAVYAAYPEFIGNQTALRVAKLANQSFAIGPGITGAWYDPNQSGHGLFLEVLPEQRLLAWWFTFDSQGRPAWLGGVGTISGNTALIEGAFTTQGGRWIPNFNPASVSNTRWGRLRFRFDSCTRGRVDFESVDPAYGSGFMDLTRLTLPAGLSCP